MPTEKEAIAEALRALDHTNEKLWTDDGSPLVSEIQRLCNDTKITRAQINEALPGFARKPTDSVAEEEQPDDEPEAPVTASTDTIVDPTSEVQADDDVELSPEEEQARLRDLAHQRVKDAEVALNEAKDRVAEAHRIVIAAEQRLTRAMNTFSAKYPPIGVAENIQQHIKRQQEILMERVTGVRAGTSALNPIDAKLMDRRRDNGRNGRPTLVTPKTAVG